MNKTNFPLPHTLPITGDFLYDFIQELPHPAHVKDPKTGQYIFTNEKNIKIYGLESVKQLIGTTVQDLDELMGSRWDNSYAMTVENLDQQVYQSKCIVKDNNRIMLTSDGFVRIQNMVKIPVLGIHNDVKAIATFSYALSKGIELTDLFNIYKKYYPKKRAAITCFLKYLKIETYFRDLPTEAELKLLLVMREDSTYKGAAKKLGVKPKTIEVHRAHIRDKLKNPSLNKLLSVIRNEFHYDST